MPGGEKLRKAKLRGVASEGMILSAAELELGEDAEVIVLEDGPAAGTALSEAGIGLAEPVLEGRGDAGTASIASASTESRARSTP